MIIEREGGGSFRGERTGCSPCDFDRRHLLRNDDDGFYLRAVGENSFWVHVFRKQKEMIGDNM